MKYLLIFILFLAIFYAGINALMGGFFRMLFGYDPRKQQPKNNQQQRKVEKDRWYAPKKDKKKIIDQNEGEYVDYEEVD